jgi:primosomal protein N' (replication factor Y)
LFLAATIAAAMSKIRTDSLFDTQQTEETCRHIIRVAFEAGVDSEFDYLVPDELWPIKTGQRVEVPFGRKDKLQIGFCVKADISYEKLQKKFKLKKVVRIIDRESLLDEQLMASAQWISSYYVCPLGQVLGAMVPAAVKKGAGVKTEKHIYLSTEIFEKTINQLKSAKQKKIARFLRERAAFDPQTTLELQSVLASVGCTSAPVKKLAEHGIIKITQKIILKSLPAIPQGMMIRTEKVTLNDDQQKALTAINSRTDSGTFGVTVLHGVTDSGKTELYIRAIEKALQMGKSAIVMLPEIALTAQTVQRFSARFENIAVMHSGLTAAARNSQWQKIKARQANVVIGARSAVFAPVSQLGLIIVDEEHEPSYKQDTAPRYNGRDVAIKRAQLANAHCILGSATPSLETLANCHSKKYFNLVRLPKRIMDLPMPEMKLVDMRQQYSTQKGVTLISKPLAEHLRKVLSKKEQAILLLNRRGYSNFIFCPSCKHILHCRNCDVTLTFHKSSLPQVKRVQTPMGKLIDYGYALCHYCGAQTLVPQKCPLCGSGLAMIGLGSQRLEEELLGKFPQARIARVDSDSMAGADYYRLLRDFGLGQIDILAGTQMLAKGLHFPNVTLVGIISADTCLYLPDFRSNERTFQLILQVAGRAGRSVKKGTVFVQTFLPDQPAIRFALAGDFEEFVKEELKHRKSCNLPPFWRLAVVGMRDINFERLEAASKTMRERIDSIVKQENLKMLVRGPMPATISRIQRFHRLQIIIQAPQAQTMMKLFNRLRSAPVIRPAVKVVVDMDPVNLL